MSRSLVRLLARAKGVESPTPVIIFGGPLFNPSRWNWGGVVDSLSLQGYEVYECDFLRPQWKLCKLKNPADDLADMLHSELQLARVCFPPLALSFGLESVLLQKYLESYALAGLVMVDPMPPSLTAALECLGLPNSSVCNSRTTACKNGPHAIIFASTRLMLLHVHCRLFLIASFRLKLRQTKWCPAITALWSESSSFAMH